MGLVVSAFTKLTKKKITTKERLEQIEEDIEKIQTLLRRNHEKQKSAVLLLLIASFALYLLCAMVFYLFYMPTQWIQKIFFVIPFLLFPVLVFGLKRGLHWVFVTRISKNSQQLENLKKEKQKILENVMETETYKVAKEILEKFDPNRKLVEKDKKSEQSTPTQGMELRKRNTTTLQNHQAGPIGPIRPMTPRAMAPGMQSTPRMLNGAVNVFQSPHMPSNPYQSPLFRGPAPMGRAPTPAPILPRDRSFVDKVAEYFVGDGPNNRYALICKQCAGHNGMALAEEFEFVAYKCCYCGMLNPARKQRLSAPKLEAPKLSREDSTLSLNKDDDDPDEKDEKQSAGEPDSDSKEESDKADNEMANESNEEKNEETTEGDSKE